MSEHKWIEHLQPWWWGGQDPWQCAQCGCCKTISSSPTVRRDISHKVKHDMKIGLVWDIVYLNNILSYRFEASHTPAEVLKTVTLLDTPGILAGGPLFILLVIVVEESQRQTNMLNQVSFIAFWLNFTFFAPQERNSWWIGDMTLLEFSAGLQKELIGKHEQKTK